MVAKSKEYFCLTYFEMHQSIWLWKGFCNCRYFFSCFLVKDRHNTLLWLKKVTLLKRISFVLYLGHQGTFSRICNKLIQLRCYLLPDCFYTTVSQSLHCCMYASYRRDGTLLIPLTNSEYFCPWPSKDAFKKRLKVVMNI